MKALTCSDRGRIVEGLGVAWNESDLLLIGDVLMVELLFSTDSKPLLTDDAIGVLRSDNVELGLVL